MTGNRFEFEGYSCILFKLEALYDLFVQQNTILKVPAECGHGLNIKSCNISQRCLC